MARIRSIKPDFFRSLSIAEHTVFERLLFVGLWTEADDHGRLIDDVRLIKAALFPLDDDVDLVHVGAALDALAKRGHLHRYTVDGRGYLVVVNFHRHQAINRPGKPKHPAPPVPIVPTDPAADGYCRVCAGEPETTTREPSPVAPGTLTESSVNAHGGLTPGREQGREQGGGTRVSSERMSPHPQPSPTEPPLKCPRHTNDPTSPPCGACADARRTHDAWSRARTEAAKAVPTPVPDAPACPVHPDAGPGSGRSCPACEADRPQQTPNLRVLMAATREAS